jgi:hypothetical protein
MNTSTYRETPQHSAKIYQFPVRSRMAVADQRASTDAADLMAQRVSDAVGACWYHDAAIKQSTGPTKP